MKDNDDTMTAAECLPFPKQSTFAQIRKNFDSGHSYLVFEDRSQPNEAARFKAICEDLAAPNAGVLKQTFYKDRETAHLLLVAQLCPDSDSQWQERMAAEDLPRGISFYFYGKTV